jgi:hypothetical protein
LDYVASTGVLTLRNFDTVAGTDKTITIEPTGLTLPNAVSITFGDATIQTTAAVTFDPTGYATESWVTSQGYLTSAPVTSVAGRTGAITLAVADVSDAAPLASPTFTGTPSLPTGTIGVTQTAGNNTTALATTAFVQQEVPDFATIAQARSFNNTTAVLSPQMANWQAMSQNIIQIQRAGFTVTNTGTITFTQAGWNSSRTRTGTAGACSCRWRVFGTSAVDQVIVNTDKANPGQHLNFSKPSWCSGRSILGIMDDAVMSWGFYHGKLDSDAVGVLTRRGYGWRATGGSGTRYLSLEVHDGTTLTSVTSSYAITGAAFDWDIISDGTGNVTLYINGSSVATSTAGPTGLTYLAQPVIWQEEVATSAAAASAFNGMNHSRGRFICFD